MPDFSNCDFFLQQAFRHIDFDYVVKCAEIAKEKGVSHMSYVSSQGANPNSWFLYPKTKGEVHEPDVTMSSVVHVLK